MDLVIPLGPGSCHADMELRFLLRSAELYMENLTQVVVVGIKPPWLRNCLHIPASDPLPLNKDANIALKIGNAVKSPKVSDPFLWSCDDHVFLASVSEEQQLIPSGRKWPAEDLGARHRNRWKLRRLHTWKWFASRTGPAPVYYDVHAPQPVHGDFEELVRSTPFLKDPGLLVNSIYLNLSTLHPEHARGRETKVMRHVQTKEELLSRLRGKLYAAYNNKGFCPAMRQVLTSMFKEKSGYEN